MRIGGGADGCLRHGHVIRGCARLNSHRSPGARAAAGRRQHPANQRAEVRLGRTVCGGVMVCVLMYILGGGPARRCSLATPHHLAFARQHARPLHADTRVRLGCVPLDCLSRRDQT